MSQFTKVYDVLQEEKFILDRDDGISVAKQIQKLELDKKCTDFLLLLKQISVSESLVFACNAKFFAIVNFIFLLLYSKSGRTDESCL